MCQIEGNSSLLQQQIKKFQSSTANMLENYHLTSNYIPNYSFTLNNTFLYPPVMFYDPSHSFVPQNFTPFHLNFTPNFTTHPLTTSLPEPSIKPCETSQERLQTEDQWKANSQNICDSKPKEDLVQPIKISNRNVLPNNLNLLLSYVRRVNKSGKMVEKIIKRLDEGKNYTSKKFYSYQAYVKEQIPFHKTKHTLKEITEYNDTNYSIFSIAEQRFYNKVCRILISDFLKKSYLPTLLTSSKIHKTSKLQHLKIRKFLLLKLRNAQPREMEPYRLIQN